MSFQEHDSVEEMFEFIRKQKEIAIANIRPSQQKLADGLEHFYYQHQLGHIDVVGRIAPLEETLGIERGFYPLVLQGMDREEFESISTRLRRNLAEGFVHVKAYSVIVPKGELGIEHVSTMIEIQKELFEAILKRLESSL